MISSLVNSAVQNWSRGARCAVLATALALSGCNASDILSPKHEKPLPYNIVQKLKAKGMKASSPIMIRIFKTENVLEIWKPTRTGQYARLESFEICKWSGKLGPKFKEGDRQAPEGFYTVSPRQMNPNSSYHLSFNMGFPNSYDRSHDRTGTYLMIHGACSSAGCYSMNDDQVEVIYALAREAFEGGQTAFQIQAFPFRMTAKNMAKHINSPHFEFWRMLKQGYDHFELTKRPPKVDVCGRQYVFNQKVKDGSPLKARAECPAMGMPKSLAVAFSERQIKEHEAFQSLLKWQNKPQTFALAAPEVLDGSILENAIVPEVKPPGVEKVTDPEVPAAETATETATETPAQPRDGEIEPKAETAPAPVASEAAPSAPAAETSTADAAEGPQPSAVAELPAPEQTAAADTGAAPTQIAGPSSEAVLDGSAPLSTRAGQIVLPETGPIPQPAVR